MAELKTLARPYAEGVFALARERKELARWSDMLGLLAGVVSHERVARLVADPGLGRERLIGFLLDVCGARLSPEGKNFVHVLIENDRLALLPAIAEEFAELRAEAEGVVDVEAISAFELTPAQIEQVTAAVRRRLGREIRLATRVDPALIGGVVIRAGDLVIDGSVKGHLRDLASRLTQ